MDVSKITTIGGSLGICIPKNVVEREGLKKGDFVAVDLAPVEFVRKINKPRTKSVTTTHRKRNRSFEPDFINESNTGVEVSSL